MMKIEITVKPNYRNIRKRFENDTPKVVEFIESLPIAAILALEDGKSVIVCNDGYVIDDTIL